MLQSYKLRLGDGTVLVVDHDGLSIWQADRKALVQPVGSTQWKPLKGFLAQERSAARRAARRQPKQPSTSREALPLVYPKPRGEPASRPPSGKVPAPQPPGARKGDREPIPARADGLPLIPPPPPKAPPAPVVARQAAGPRADTNPTADSELPRISSTPPVIPPPPILSPKPPIISMRPPIISTRPPIISQPPPSLSPKPRDDRDKVPPLPAPSVPRARVEPPAAPMVVQPLAEEPATLSTESVPPVLPSDEDVEWMALPTAFDKPLDDEPPTLPAGARRDPVEPSSAGARPSLLQEALLRAPSRAVSAGETLLTRAINSLARRDWQATRLWLICQAASAHRALLALWKSLARGDRPLPSLSPGEPSPWRAVESERSAPLPPRPAVAVPSGVRVPADKRTDSLGAYRPRRSTDGLPILQLEPLDDQDDDPEIILEPLDDEVPAPRHLPKPPLPSRDLPVPRPADPPRSSASPWAKRLGR